MKLTYFLMILFFQIPCFAQDTKELFKVLGDELKSYNRCHLIFDVKKTNYAYGEVRQSMIVNTEKSIESLPDNAPQKAAAMVSLKKLQQSPSTWDNHIKVIADIVSAFKWRIDCYDYDRPDLSPMFTYIADGSGIVYCIIPELHRIDIRRDVSAVLDEQLSGIPVFSTNNSLSKDNAEKTEVLSSNSEIYLKVSRHHQDQDSSVAVIFDKKTLQCIGFEGPHRKTKTISKGEIMVLLPNPDFDKKLEQAQIWKVVEFAPIQDVTEANFHYKFEPGYTVNMCKNGGAVEKTINSASLVN